MKKPKSIKVFYGDTRLKDIYPHATRFQVMKYNFAQFMRKVFIVMVGTAFTTIIFIIMKDVYITKELDKLNTVTVVEETKELPAVMQRIAQCESGNKHYKENGQIVTNANTNGTVDIGRFQINEKVWGKKAGELNLNLADEKDNITFAMWIYENFGTEDWKYSRTCWAY
jgi:hypothetical protein